MDLSDVKIFIAFAKKEDVENASKFVVEQELADSVHLKEITRNEFLVVVIAYCKLHTIRKIFEDKCKVLYFEEDFDEDFYAD